VFYTLGGFDNGHPSRPTERLIRTSQEEGLAPAVWEKRGQAALPDLFSLYGMLVARDEVQSTKG
jgi:hypothetical protein